jgi:hypothetical protein
MMQRHEKYMLGRKLLLVSGFASAAIFVLFESNTLSRTLRVVGPVSTLKQVPLSKFQLGPGVEYSLTIGDAQGEEDTTGIETTTLAFYGPPLQERGRFDVSDNVMWDTGNPLLKIHSLSEALEWFRFSQRSSSPGPKHKLMSSKKILIAQYSNKGALAEVFKLTKPLNMRYAEFWRHDIVFLNGQQLPLEEANLASLLELAWDERINYDYVFLMDADSMMINLQFDIAQLLPTAHMVAAKRPSRVEDWQVYDAVSFWNLNHLLVPRVAKAWANSFEKDGLDLGLEQQLKPYDTEIYRLSGKIGPDRSARVRTMDRTWKSHSVGNADTKALLNVWRKEAHSACKKFGMEC